MTKRTRRRIASRLKEIEEERALTEWKVHTDVVTVTDSIVDDSGNTIEEKVPDPESPDGWELGRIVPTQSPVVTVHELVVAETEEP